MKPTLRKPLLAFHLWAGLTVGVVVIVVALSGAVLMFRGQLERRLDAQRFIVQPGTTRLVIDDLVVRARATHPQSELESVRFYGDPTMPLLVYFANKEYVHVNPYTGAVLGTRQRYGEGFGWIEGLHKYLRLDSATGETVNGSLAFGFSALLITGLVLWWPATRRALRAGLTINPKLSGRPWNLSLHKSVGFYTALVLLVSALTGAPIALDWLKASLYPLTGSIKAAPPKVQIATGETIRFVGFEAIAQRMQTIMPGAQETYIPLPKIGVVPSYAMAAGASHPNARSYVWFDGATAEVLRSQPYAQAPAGFRLYYWMMSLHMGLIGGWPVKIVFLLGVFAVPLLAYTGIASYLKRKSRGTAPVPVASARQVAVLAK